MNKIEKIKLVADVSAKYKGHITGITDAFITVLETVADQQQPTKQTPEYGDDFKHKIFFENGYGISLVHHKGSYGLECGLIHKDSNGLIYTDEFNDVRGHLDGEGLLEALTIAKNLKPIKDE